MKTANLNNITTNEAIKDVKIVLPEDSNNWARIRDISWTNESIESTDDSSQEFTKSLFGNVFTVILYDFEARDYTYLYDDIPTYEEAEILAQYAMHTKNNNDSIVMITPGFNVYDPNRFPILEMVEELAKKYKYQL